MKPVEEILKTEIENKGRQLIVLMEFGSQLYGTNTPESDIDLKGVFIPSWSEVLLGRIPKSINVSTNPGDEKNTKDDIDVELFSLHQFIKLSCEGQTVALDMLHAPMDRIQHKTVEWCRIVAFRERFYTKNLKAFFGYCKSQAAKYGVKGSRLNAVKSVLDVLLWEQAQRTPPWEEMRLATCWQELMKLEGEHISFSKNVKGLDEIECCGRKVQSTVTVVYAIDVFKKYYDNYGKRAEAAAKNEGIDWKAISHAIRVGMELKELLTDGTITFPLPEAEYLKKVKRGDMDYTTEAGPYMEALIDEVEKLSNESGLPEKVDRKYWDDFIEDVFVRDLQEKIALGFTEGFISVVHPRRKEEE